MDRKFDSFNNEFQDEIYEQFIEKTKHITDWSTIAKDGKLELIEDMNTIWILKGKTLEQLVEHYLIKKLDRYYDEN